MDRRDEILKKYPKIFPKGEVMFSCKPGWYDLLDTLCERLQSLTDRNNTAQVVADQVKEKFATLHFYAINASPEQRAMIELAEAMSERICDECGHPGQHLVAGYWHVTRCAEHAPPEAVTYAEFEAKFDAK